MSNAIVTTAGYIARVHATTIIALIGCIYMQK